MPNSFKKAKQAETGKWLWVSNYLDEKVTAKLQCC